MASGAYSVFDGRTLTLYDNDGNVVGSWPAIAGARGYQQPSLQGLENYGRPEGNYSFSADRIQKLSPVMPSLDYLVAGVIRAASVLGTERVFLIRIVY